MPVSGLDILYITDRDTDPVLSPLIRDLNQAHDLLLRDDNRSLFPSSFLFESFRPQLPSALSLSDNAASAALLGALRGKGIPLSYKTDREAVEWAFAVLLSGAPEKIPALHAWIGRIRGALAAGEKTRVALLCDLCDPFSAGAAFALLRFLKDRVGTDPCDVSFFCLGVEAGETPEFRADTLRNSLQALQEQDLAGRPEESQENMRTAVRIAAAFDRDPVYTLENIVFTEHTKDVSFYDSSGPTALDGLKQVLSDAVSEDGYEISEEFRNQFEREIGRYA